VSPQVVEHDDRSGAESLGQSTRRMKSMKRGLFIAPADVRWQTPRSFLIANFVRSRPTTSRGAVTLPGVLTRCRLKRLSRPCAGVTEDPIDVLVVLRARPRELVIRAPALRTKSLVRSPSAQPSDVPVPSISSGKELAVSIPQHLLQASREVVAPRGGSGAWRCRTRAEVTRPSSDVVVAVVAKRAGCRGACAR
jgi:hypothetical protein